MTDSVLFGIGLIAGVALGLLAYGVEALLADRRHARDRARERQRQIEASRAWRAAWRGPLVDGPAPVARTLYQGPRPPVNAPDGAVWTGDYGKTTYVRKGDAWVLR